ncbi:DUF5689 domain-containing protein [Spongiimicrobium sp. 2-473A-2-J]|uniref:DUF5689 domain-containing protein n=1 Tax=Eudoraea algarum TaxID=3417568 RepID=UPI003D3626E6
MGNLKRIRSGILGAMAGLVLLWNCVGETDFGIPEGICAKDMEANTTFAEVKALFAGETMQIQQDLTLEGYVISSDRSGNFYGTLHLQDHPTRPTEGIQLHLDLRDLHLFYPLGSKVYVRVKGLYLGKQQGVFKLGGTFDAFGHLSIGRLPALKIDEHLSIACEAPAQLSPKKITLAELREQMVNTLVQLDSIEVLEEEVGLVFALPREDTERRLKDCHEGEIVLLNSGFSDFQDHRLPEGNGSITGVLSKGNKAYRLVIRELGDIDFSKERCRKEPEEFTSPNIFISELADPYNHTGARFVELYHAGTEPIPLKGWMLHRYTNANTEVGSSIDLSDLVIGAKGTVVISPNAAEFEGVYGFPPDLSSSKNGPADSNGDDNLVLVDPFGSVIDAFGVIGEDGSGTNHEFEDGRAVRNPDISKGNPVYDFKEWTLYNDTGGAGTIKQPQNAPADFGPGRRD